MKKTKLKKQSSLPIARLKQKLDKIFSIFIRNRGKGICFTCGLKRTPKLMQCGHFISRTHSSTRWNDINCQSQCFACNIWKRGNIAEFSARLIEKYGMEEFKNLIAEGRKIKQWKISELEELIKKYEDN